MTKDQEALIIQSAQIIKNAQAIWWFLPGPQTKAFFSKADCLFYGGAAGGGKGMDINIPIPSPNAFILMGDIKVGDKVFDEKGKICNVIAVSEINNRDCYELTFDDGSKIIADDVHRWFTRTDSDRVSLIRRNKEFRENRKKNRESIAVEESKRPWVSKSITEINKNRVHEYLEPSNGSIRSTVEIFETLKLGSGRINHSIDICSPIDLPEANLPVDPYMLGIHLGDGATANGYLGMIESDMDFVLKNVPYSVKSHKVYGKPKYNVPFKTVIFNGLREDLKEIGVIGDKHIPDIYLRSSIAQRKELLRGILDTDGHVTNSGSIELGLSCKKLIDNVLELVCSLGIKATIRTKKTKCKDSYRIKFMANFEAFKLPRKLTKQKTSNFRDTTKRRYIVDVKKIDSVPTKCIAVDSESHLYLAGNSFIPTHNTDLLLGCAYHNHINSIIFRREYKQLSGLIKRSEHIFNAVGKLNRKDLIWKFNNSKTIEFGATQYVENVKRFQGLAHDYKGFDEITHFTEEQFRFLTGWTRTSVKNQRTRIVCAGNPPTDDEGFWVKKYWAAWLDKKHPNPALPGELRWYTTIDDKEIELDSADPIIKNGEIIIPQSRTFIPAKMGDNPFLDEKYRSMVQALKEPMRSQLLYGDFDIGECDKAWQLIPTEWVLQAQARWRERQRPDIKMTALGVDVARGGKDKTILSPRYGNYFDTQIVKDGLSTPDSDYVVNLILENSHKETQINLDVIGVGAAVYDTGRKVIGNIIPLNSAGASEETDKSGLYPFINSRAQWWWQFMEMLDPKSGMDICIPDDPELKADLCAPTYKITPRGIKIEEKDRIKERIGRSPDKGDAIVYASAFSFTSSLDLSAW